jgi:hypothetical protein
MFLVQGILAFCLRLAGLWIGWRILGDDIWAIALFSLGGAIAALALVVLVAFRIARIETSKARAGA